MVEKLPKKLRLEIVTPSRQFFFGEVDAVTVPGIEGYLGILPGHAPLLSELKIGVISYREGEVTTKLFCKWGFVEVLPDEVSILAEVAETADEIDPENANAEKAKAETLLRSKSEDTDFASALQLWESAVARLEVTGS